MRCAVVSPHSSFTAPIVSALADREIEAIEFHTPNDWIPAVEESELPVSVVDADAFADLQEQRETLLSLTRLSENSGGAGKHRKIFLCVENPEWYDELIEEASSGHLRIELVHKKQAKTADRFSGFLSLNVKSALIGSEKWQPQEKDPEHKYRFFFDHMPIAAVVCDENYVIQEWNEEAENLFGYSREEALGEILISLVYSEENQVSSEDLKTNLQNTLINKERSKNVNYDKTKDGRHLLCEWFDLPYISEEGKFIFSVARDATQDKKAVDSLNTAMEQKEMMIQEVHHRLKNNLTMITSLINLRMHENRDEDVLQDTQAKIRAVSSLYEKLYTEGETSNVEISSYLEDLLYSLFTTLSRSHFHIDMNIDELYVDPETAIALGLLANEIATNALKHGFREGEDCTFSVSLDTQKGGGEKGREDSGGGAEGSYLLTLSNTGNPFPASVDIENSSSLGLQLIDTLVQQLNGELELVKEPSASYRISIPADRFRHEKMGTD